MNELTSGRREVKQLTGNHWVPALVADDGTVIQGSREIIEWAKGEMAAYKYPRTIEFVESLPKSGSGKVLWRMLQEQEKQRAAVAQGAGAQA